MTHNPANRQAVTVGLQNGLHLVPCSLIAQLARRYQCNVRIHKATLTVDAKNVLELMTLNADCGTQLEVSAEGERADEAIAELVKLFQSNFEPAQPQADAGER